MKTSIFIAIKKIINLLLNCIYPKKCVGCEREGGYICFKCFQTIPKNKIENIQIESIDEVITCCSPNIITSKLIYYLKYHSIAEIAFYLAKLYCAKFVQNIKYDEYTIIPVPLHKSRYKNRGYNQCEKIILEIQKLITLKANFQILERIKNTKSQKELKRETRLKNVRDAFLASSKSPKKVILLDDVLTTGATLKHCAQALRRGGTQEIIAIVLTHGTGVQN